MERTKIERVAKQYGIRCDGLTDSEAAKIVVSAATGKDARDQSEAYLAAAIGALAQYPETRRDAAEVRNDDPRLPAVGDRRADASAAYRRARYDHEQAWKAPLTASRDPGLPPGRDYAHTDGIDSLRGTAAACRADAMRVDERRWMEPLTASREAVYARELGRSTP